MERTAGSYQVAVVGADNKVNIRAVKAGDRVGPMWIVEGGVKPGEQVVVEGLQNVQNGGIVKSNSHRRKAIDPCPSFSSTGPS